MKQLIFILLAILITKSNLAQNPDWKKIHALQPDRILQTPAVKPTKVLLVGSFHFDYPNLDGHKTDSANFIDVLSASRQKEIDELNDVLGRFKPTKIYIESSNERFHDSLYNQFVKGNYQAGRNEIYQVAYKLAKKLGHSKLYAVDAGSFLYEQSKHIPILDSLNNVNLPVNSRRDDYWNNQYKKMYDTADSIEVKLSMLENFLLMAQPATLQRMHGHYLSSGFNTKDNSGPDLLSMWWYNRNLRIFNNILQTKPSSDDRILVLFGNGHMPILQHCFYASPEFELVPLATLLSQ
jgi:hypothetical protein